MDCRLSALAMQSARSSSGSWHHDLPPTGGDSIPDDEPDLEWFNQPRIPSNPDPHGFDQSPRWAPREVPLDDERILVVDAEPPPPDEFAQGLR
jgi:hypothetical protein